MGWAKERPTAGGTAREAGTHSVGFAEDETGSRSLKSAQALFSSFRITSSQSTPKRVLPRVAEARLRDLEARAQLCRGGPEPEPRIDRAYAITHHEFALARRRRGRA